MGLLSQRDHLPYLQKPLKSQKIVLSGASEELARGIDLQIRCKGSAKRESTNPNCLSHDNLGVLFDLCQTLDLQLLIAAPEVAPTHRATSPSKTRSALPSCRRCPATSTGARPQPF